LKASLIIVSAGLGLIDEQRWVPAYSLTLARTDPDSIARKVLDDFSPPRWWQALHRALGVSDGALLKALSGRGGLILVALPATYLELVAVELWELPPTVLSRVRLIGPPRRAVPARLSDFWMPYDARFDGEGGPLPGTRGDFAQRATRHFAQEVAITAPSASAGEHAEMVKRHLSSLTARPSQSRAQGSDAELIAVIRKLLSKSGGRSGETLRLLRREAGRACEQGRFRRLFAIATSREATS
jgi:hypothetical protein